MIKILLSMLFAFSASAAFAMVEVRVDYTTKSKYGYETRGTKTIKFYAGSELGNSVDSSDRRSIFAVDGGNWYKLSRKPHGFTDDEPLDIENFKELFAMRGDIDGKSKNGDKINIVAQNRFREWIDSQLK